GPPWQARDRARRPPGAGRAGRHWRGRRSRSLRWQSSWDDFRRRVSSRPMSLLLDSFWRAVFYCLHPRVIGLSLLPLVLMVAFALGLGYFFWDTAVNTVFVWLESTAWIESLSHGLRELGLGNLKNALAPLLVIFAVTPVLVVLVLFLVSVLM